MEATIPEITTPFESLNLIHQYATSDLTKADHTENSHFAAIINHGESVKHARLGPRKEPPSADPPLTPRGLKQARATADFLKEYFSGNSYRFDKVIVECSPFLRCMVTAAQIAKRFGVEEVVINYSACDVLLEKQYKENPLYQVEYCKHDCDFKRMVHRKVEYSTDAYFPEGINFKESERDLVHMRQVIALHPETEAHGK